MKILVKDSNSFINFKQNNPEKKIEIKRYIIQQ